MSEVLRRVVDKDGVIALLAELHLTTTELANALGLSPEALLNHEHLYASATQQRLSEAIEILRCIEPWAGSISSAWSWYRTHAIAAFGGLTAESLVACGRAEDVKTYLSHISEGGYA